MLTPPAPTHTDVLAYKHDKNPNLHKKPVKQHQVSTWLCVCLQYSTDRSPSLHIRTLLSPVHLASTCHWTSMCQSIHAHCRHQLEWCHRASLWSLHCKARQRMS